MTTPGRTLQESVSRLADVIGAARATSDERKQRVAEQATPAVQIGQEVRDASGGGEPDSA